MSRAKEQKMSNLRVTVEPYISPWSSREPDQKQLKRQCDDIAAAIKRHVDGVGSVTVEAEHTWHCEHCDAEWTEQSNDYNGGCCNKDEENNPEHAKENA